MFCYCDFMASLENMKVIVTGGAGFIGSHLVDRLLADGHEVVCIDSLVSGCESNIVGAKKSPKFSMINADLKSCENRKFEGVDIVFHMAAYPIRQDRLFDYKTYLEQTEGGTLSALEIARKNDIPLFVMPGTTGLYGQAKVVPTPESFVGPDPSFYGTSKYNSERWCEAYSGLFGLNVLIDRFGRILGPRSRNGSVWELIHRLLDNPKELRVLGNGTQVRSYVHVKDCVEGMMVSLKNRGGSVDRFNIANDDTATVKDMIKIILEEYGPNSTKVVYAKEPVGWKGDPAMAFPDAAKLESCGWKPTKTSKEAIRDCVRWTLSELKKKA